MEQTEEKKETQEVKEKQRRKKYAKAGVKTGKMCSYRLDWETMDILDHVGNKGRLINDLIKEWWKKQKPSSTYDADANPKEDDGHDVES